MSAEKSLNIMCAICNEFYKINEKVFTTTACGHMFHHNCLFRWLARSSTCPQCRHECHRHQVHRVYLNFGEYSSEDDVADQTPANFTQWILLDDLSAAPTGAVKSGTDPDGNDSYVARMSFNGDLLPVNFVPNKNCAFAPWGCQGHTVEEDIEVLVNPECAWVPAANGHVPDNAISIGYTEHGEDLYTGRAVYKDILLGGKVHRSHGVLYMPYNDEEVNAKEYEVLVHDKPNK